MKKQVKKVLREEFEEEKAEEEAEREPAGEGAEKESSVAKEGTSLPGDGEEDINEGISWEGLEMDADFDWLLETSL